LQKSSINTWIAEEFDQHRNLGIALAVFQQLNMMTIHEEKSIIIVGFAKFLLFLQINADHC
jgi:hypothetical protein